MAEERPVPIQRASEEKPTLYQVRAPVPGSELQSQITHIVSELNRVLALISTEISRIKGKS